MILPYKGDKALIFGGTKGVFEEQEAKQSNYIFDPNDKTMTAFDFNPIHSRIAFESQL